MQTAAAPSYLSPTQNIRYVSEEYFKDGLRIIESIEYYTKKLEMEENEKFLCVLV